ncbi:MAG: dihydrodipicolinate synthase family protein [Kiritimatiellaeota bacterium]|nr:dihydrodipicolinate synthase family protein [Kiritimatiellota bacterium]
MQKFKGIMPAIISPCDANDGFCEDAFAAVATYLYGQSVHGLYVCGATGDGFSMRLDERKRATEIAAKVSKDFKGVVITHVGATNNRDACELGAHAAKVGADAVSSMPPSNKSYAQLKDYYTAATKAAGIPLFIYHIPAVTGQNLSLPQLLELLDIPGVVGLKFSDANLFVLKRILLERPKAIAFNGNDELLCPGLLYGAHGGIGLTYNIFPKLFVKLYEAVQSGDWRRAMELQNSFQPFLGVAINHNVFAVLNLMMKEKGFGPFCTRRPRIELSAAQAKQFHAEADGYLAIIEKTVAAK